MTGFLARAATRAVGRQAAAQPRPAGIHGRRARDAGPAGIETLEPEVTATAPSPEASGPDVPASPDPETCPAPEPDARTLPPRPAARLSPAVAARGRPARDPVVAAAPRAAASTEAVGLAADAGADTATVTHAPVPGTTDPVPASPAAVFAVDPPLAVARPATSGPPAAFAPPPAAREDPAPVRVHIGRLEVRATLSEPPPRPQRTEARRPDLSLSEYLRGERAAR